MLFRYNLHRGIFTPFNGVVWWIMTNVYSYVTTIQIQKIFHYPKMFLFVLSLSISYPDPQHLATTILLFIFIVLPFRKCHINGMLWFIDICVWLFNIYLHFFFSLFTLQTPILNTEKKILKKITINHLIKSLKEKNIENNWQVNGTKLKTGSPFIVLENI